MSSPLMEYLGIAGMDIAYLFIAIFILLIAIIVLLIVQIVKYSKLKKKYEKFMRGRTQRAWNRILSHSLKIISLLRMRTKKIARISAKL